MSAPVVETPPWSLRDLVLSLRHARSEPTSQSSRWYREAPSRAAVEPIVAGLRAALFPRHFGAPDLTDEGLDYFVGYTLDVTLRALGDQVRRALRYAAPLDDEAARRQAEELTRAFAQGLPTIRETLQRDVQAAFDGDPAARDLDEVILCYPGVTAITHHRIAHALYALGVPLLARSMAELAHATTGIDIHPGAKIGGSFFIDHGTGVVIGETAELGERVKLYQGVTLGARSFPTDAHGVVIKGVPRHPILEDDVVVYSGATILGRVVIGRGSSIGGNVWLTRSVPPGSRISQAQLRTEMFDEGAGI